MIYGFTQAIICELLKDQDKARQTVREWIEAYPDPHDREKLAIEFAVQLDKDFKGQYLSNAGCGDGLIDAFLKIGFMRTNWRTVAEYLLDRFCPLPDRQCAFWTAMRVPSCN